MYSHKINFLKYKGLVFNIFENKLCFLPDLRTELIALKDFGVHHLKSIFYKNFASLFL